MDKKKYLKRGQRSYVLSDKLIQIVCQHVYRLVFATVTLATDKIASYRTSRQTLPEAIGCGNLRIDKRNWQAVMNLMSRTPGHLYILDAGALTVAAAWFMLNFVLWIVIEPTATLFGCSVAMWASYFAGFFGYLGYRERAKQ